MCSKLEVFVISLAGTQINPSLLPSKDYLRIVLFQHQPATSILSNTSNELISRRQHGGSIMSIRGELSKYATATGSDPIGLSRWKYVDLGNRGNK